MSRGAWIRFIIVLGLLAGCAALALNKEPRLGLDLKGGAQFIFQAEGTDDVPASAENVDETLEVLRKRVDALGVAESTLVRQGEDRILVELPGVTNDEEAQEAEEQIGRTAQLTVHEVYDLVEEGAEPSEEGRTIMPTAEGEFLEIGPAVIKGADVTGADPAQPENSTGWVVQIDFNRKAGDAWADITGAAACNPSGDPKRRVAIVLDGEAITSPQVEESVGCNVGITGGGTQITGNFDVESAKDLAALIQGGSLPLELTAISDRLVGPTLGEAAIDASLKAGVSGLILTGLFIMLVYRLVGAMAAVALVSYALLAYAILLALGSTLTLPGLAGFVLAIGMAIDANVLVFERAREEYAAAPEAGLRRALGIGFNKAWTAIIDSNVTTLIAGALLFFLGSGPIKGFGVTVSIGVLASMISALIVARVLTDIAVSRKVVERRTSVSGMDNIGRVRTWLDRKDPDIIKRRGTWLGISGALTVVALLGIVTQGLNLGVEFSGGRQLDYSLAEEISVEQARDAVEEAGFAEAVVQTADTADFTIRTRVITNEEEQQIVAALEEVGGEVTKVDDQTIGAALGTELRNNAVIAFAAAFLLQLIYLAFRFKWTFGLAAIITMFHDVIVVVGLFAWLHKPIDGIFLAAVMTIIGLSVNDTVVIFDRIRERWRASGPESSFAREANKAAIETVPRTVNTGLGTMFILATLAIFGGDSLRDFAIALLVGLVVGTYSSVFAATPLMTYFHAKWPMTKEVRVRAERDPSDSGAVV